MYNESKMRNHNEGFFGDSRTTKGYNTERSNNERISQISALPGPSRQEAVPKQKGVK